MKTCIAFVSQPTRLLLLKDRLKKFSSQNFVFLEGHLTESNELVFVATATNL